MNGMTIAEQLQVIAEQAQNEFQVVLMWVCIGALVTGLLAVLAAVSSSKVRKLILWLGPVGCSLVLPGAFHLYVYGATKPPKPQITWDAGLHDNQSTFDTNTWASVTFNWTKDTYIPNTDPLFFAMKARDAGADIMPVDIGETTAGALTWTYNFTGGENATNYLYYAYLGGSVHTNGVWLGNVLIKQYPGNGGVDKMVIIRGKLEVNGKQIAPPQN